MKHYFFNLSGNFQSIADQVFQAVGIKDFYERESFNVLNYSYFSYSIFGVLFKVEENSYDFEDRYKYMLTIRKDMTTKLLGVNDDLVLKVSNCFISLLINNLQDLHLAEENDNGDLSLLTK